MSPGGIAQVAGLQAGDVIYRVGGVDVEDNIEATARLSLLIESADTVHVNFLRRGRAVPRQDPQALMRAGDSRPPPSKSAVEPDRRQVAAGAHRQRRIVG